MRQMNRFGVRRDDTRIKDVRLTIKEQISVTPSVVFVSQPIKLLTTEGTHKGP